jgi:hypothetical protein
MEPENALAFTVHKNPLLVPILGQFNTVYILTTHFFNCTFRVILSPVPSVVS